MPGYDEITHVLSEPLADPQYLEAVRWVKQAAEAIQASGVVPQMRVRVVPGHQVNAGQQLNVVLDLPQTGAKSFQETLFRAYVPGGGNPVQLDFYGESLTPAINEGEFQQKVAEFAKGPLRKRLTMLKESV